MTASVPYLFAPQAGPIPLSELDADFAYVLMQGANPGAILYGQNAAEAAAGVTPTNDISKLIATPKRYGAAGDGVTNDTVAVQTWINSGNKDLYLDDGATYLITGVTITGALAANIKIQGSGQLSQFLISSAAGSYGFQVVWSNAEAGAVGTALTSPATTHFNSGLILKDFAINCQAGPNQSYGFWLNNAEILYAENIVIDMYPNTFAGSATAGNPNGTYGWVGYFMQDGVYVKCEFTGGSGVAGDGIAILGVVAANQTSNNNLFLGCRAQECGGYGVRNQAADGSVWYGGKFQGNTAGGWLEAEDINGAGATDTVIEAAGFEGNSGYEFQGQVSTHMVVRNNTFESTSVTGIFNQAFCDYMLFEDNRTYNNKSCTIVASGSGATNVWGRGNLGFGLNNFTNGTMQAQTGAPVVLTYSASITPDASMGEYFTLNVTNGTAFTINYPTNLGYGQRLTLDITNSSGGAMGTVTFNASYFLAGALTQAATGHHRVISFQNDGLTGLVEQYRSVADIAT
jgi:hypothetical protein